MTRLLEGLEWGPDGIRTVGIAPGPIQGTEGLSRLSGMSGDEVGQRIPVRRAGYPEGMRFFCSVLCACACA
jgi:NAD(P)-dependent dehydrogenase (short-subunit alcohol dehydrogenase family)